MLNETIQSYILRLGADKVGFADLSDIDKSLIKGFPRGISILVALEPKIIKNIESGPNLPYYDEYNRVNTKLYDMASKTVQYIQSLGYKAYTNPSTIKVIRADNRTDYLPHKTVATKSGLGWIGKSALLITREFGAACRLISVYTDAPFSAGKAVVKSQCGVCTNCLRACPSKAIKGPVWEAGLEREVFYDASKCRKEAETRSQAAGIDNTICGICINVCPYTRRYLKSRLGDSYGL